MSGTNHQMYTLEVMTSPLGCAIMVVTMRITDPGWLARYGREVRPLLAEYEASCLAAGTDVAVIEGAPNPPGRVAVFAFPSTAALHAFLADERYRALRELRQAGSESDIVAFTNTAAPDRFA